MRNVGLFKRKKKPQYVEEVLEIAPDQPVIKKQEPKETRHLALEYCEQIMTAANDLEETKQEYKVITDYLTDIQIIEELPEQEFAKIQETAQNVLNLNQSRDAYLNKAKTISDVQFAQMEQLEDEIPDAIKRLKANEVYQTAVNRDMQYLEGEKQEWIDYQESLEQEQKLLHRLMYGVVGVFAAAVIIILVLNHFFYFDLQIALFAAVLAAGGCGGAVFWRLQNDQRGVKQSQVNINYAINLLNKTKLKYVNVTNGIDYACEKYHVKNSYELNYIWEQYLEAVKEREKYKRTNDDLEYFNGKLVRDLRAYHLYDAKVWVYQPHALLDKKEMVEVKHALLVRRQKVRSRMEEQVANIQFAKGEIEKLIKNYRGHEKEIREVLDSLDKVCRI